MSPRLGLLKRLGSDAILPPPLEEVEVKLPPNPIVPLITQPSEKQLEEEESNQRVWNELREQIMKQRSFDLALDEVQRTIRDHEERNIPTEISELAPEPRTERYVPMSERPTLLNAKLNANDLLKLCSHFYRLCTK